jgi:hypothetical protein
MARSSKSRTVELTPVIIASDNGPCHRAVGFARYIASTERVSRLQPLCRSFRNAPCGTRTRPTGLKVRRSTR